MLRDSQLFYTWTSMKLVKSSGKNINNCVYLIQSKSYKLSEHKHFGEELTAT